MNILIKGAVALVVLALPLLSIAAEGGHAASVPQVVFYQTVNFILFAILLFVLLKGRVVGHFSQRREDFTAAVKRYEIAKADAEQKAAQLKVRLEKLEASAAESIAKAKKEADDMQKKIVAEAQTASAKLQVEAKKTVEVEVARAVQELREEVLRQSTESARHLMQQQLKEPDQQRLQKEFVEKIRVAQQ
jgi:F0F1-type ATP synthase membrane subunit b/b'